MILPIEDVLKEIPVYMDTPDLVQYLSQNVMPQLSGEDAVNLDHAMVNLEGMLQLLRSARHHLAVKCLDAA